ncbi:MAG: motility protein A [Planctomycetota bacterium]|nr:motility protein A [Planctomycetota bacterium]
MLDFTTIAGLVMGVVLLSTGIIISGETATFMALRYFASLSSAFVTFGGAICATILQFPWTDLKRVPGIIAKAFQHKATDTKKLIEDMIKYAEIARRDGILALEGLAESIEDEFLVKGLQLAVDGTDPELIQQMMITELEYVHERHSQGKKVFDALATYLPAFGMIGTVMGLVMMLTQLSNPKAIGPSMALALITTFYGAVGAYLVCMPLAKKLEARSKEEGLIKEMIIRGVMSIQSGDNPRIVSQKLRIFLPPNLRPKLK